MGIGERLSAVYHPLPDVQLKIEDYDSFNDALINKGLQNHRA